MSASWSYWWETRNWLSSCWRNIRFVMFPLWDDSDSDDSSSVKFDSVRQQSVRPWTSAVVASLCDRGIPSSDWTGPFALGHLLLLNNSRGATVPTCSSSGLNLRTTLTGCGPEYIRWILKEAGHKKNIMSSKRGGREKALLNSNSVKRVKNHLVVTVGWRAAGSSPLWLIKCCWPLTSRVKTDWHPVQTNKQADKSTQTCGSCTASESL